MYRALPFLLILLYAPATFAQEANPEDVSSPDVIVQTLYDIISTPAGEAPDWDRWRTLFIPEARLIAISSNESGRNSYFTWTYEEYVSQVGPYFLENPFYEVEVSHTSERFGNLVHRFSTYESYRALGLEPFSRGINSIQLLHMDNRWWIVTIFWQSESDSLPLPKKYLPGE